MSRCIKTTVECQVEGGDSPTGSPSTSHPRRRARPQETPDQTLDVAEEVHRCVVKRLRELPAYHEEATTDEDSMSDEEDHHVCRRTKRG